MNEYVDRMRRDEHGFTLIELMIVIVILGILAGIVIFAVGGITDTGTTAACKSDVKTISVAVEAYRAKTGGYPADLVPSLTAGATQFLRPDPAFDPPGTTTPRANSSEWYGKSYVVVYKGNSGTTAGQVWVGPGTTPAALAAVTATTTCP